MTNNKYLIAIFLTAALFALPLHADVKRESLHFLTTEAGLGYSALLNKSTLGTSSGLAGAKLQVGYEWRYRKLLVHTGLEFASVNDMARVDPFQMKTSYTVGLPAGQYMTEYFDFRSFKETQMMGQLNIPVQVGAVFSDRYYFLAGARIGLPVLHAASVKTDVTTWLVDPSLIGELNNVPVHDAYTSTEKLNYAWPANIVNAQVSAEVGLVLNSFFEKPQKGKGRGSSASGRNQRNKKKPVLFRVALFADYGITSVAKTSGETKTLVQVAEPRDIAMNGYFDASQTPANSLLVGAKFAVLFQLNEQKPAKPLPSYFDIWIADAVTSKPLPARVNIYDKTKKRTTVKDVKNGHLRYRAKNGEYTLTASNSLYYPLSQDVAMEGEGITDTVRFGLRPRPWLRLRVTNTDTGEPLSVAAAVTNAATGDSVTTLTTQPETGLARTMLDDAKTYRLTIAHTGYETVIRDIANVGDSMLVSLTPIKVGKKVILHNLFFATNKTRILPQSEEALDELYAFLLDNPSLTIRITGHTDNVGSNRANQQLSEGRAAAVRDEIIKRGIAPERIEADGKGEDEPIADNKTEEGRAKNRRVEFTITSTGGALIEQVKE